MKTQFFISWNHCRVEFAWLCEVNSDGWRMDWQPSFEPAIWEI